jgi:hypothetical protein
MFGNTLVRQLPYTGGEFTKRCLKSILSRFLTGQATMCYRLYFRIKKAFSKFSGIKATLYTRGGGILHRKIGEPLLRVDHITLSHFSKPLDLAGTREYIQCGMTD